MAGNLTLQNRSGKQFIARHESRLAGINSRKIYHLRELPSLTTVFCTNSGRRGRGATRFKNFSNLKAQPARDP